MIRRYVRKVGTTKWLRLTDFGVIQNGQGVYYTYKIGGAYIKPKLRNFDTYNVGILGKKNQGGSHASYPDIEYDFSLNSDYEYCYGQTCEVLLTSKTQGWYMKTVIGSTNDFWVHTDTWVKPGRYEAWTPLGRIAERAVTAEGKVIPQHLHIFARSLNGKSIDIKPQLLEQEKDETKPVVVPVTPPAVDCEKENKLLQSKLKDAIILIDNTKLELTNTTADRNRLKDIINQINVLSKM